MSRKLAAAALGSALLLAPHLAAAHITLATQKAFADSSYKAVLRVPHGCEGKATTAIRVRIPEELAATGAIALRVRVNNRESNEVFLPVE